MNTNAQLKKEGIELISQLNQTQISKIATIVSSKICEAFPEHNLNVNDIFSCLNNLDMWLAKMPEGSAAAKYFSKNNTIYLDCEMDLNNLDTIVIHECIHAIQEIKNPRGKLLKLGLYDYANNDGQGINEAAVQLMASIATNTEKETVKYYNMSFFTPSPLFYPIETALISQIAYFTGSYPLFHSTIHSNSVFQNTFIAKSSEKAYRTISSNFDLLIYYEDLLAVNSQQLSILSDEKQNLKKIKRINEKIESIKSAILKLTLSTQNMIIENCFNSEFELIRDNYSLNAFQEKLYTFNEMLITTDSYQFYNQFYCHMMNKLEEKRKLIQEYGTLNYLSELQNDLLDLQKDNFGVRFFHRLFDKLKLLFEETTRDKSYNNYEDIEEK